MVAERHWKLVNHDIMLMQSATCVGTITRKMSFPKFWVKTLAVTGSNGEELFSFTG
jgi:hypothetical protein